MRPYPIQSGDQKIKWDFIRDAPADRSAGRCACPQTAQFHTGRYEGNDTLSHAHEGGKARPDGWRAYRFLTDGSAAGAEFRAIKLASASFYSRSHCSASLSWPLS
jgi:hypothetical protein